MDRLDQLFAHAIPIWDSRLGEARAAGADLSRIVGIVMDDGERVRTALCEPELAAARLAAFSAPLPCTTVPEQLRTSTEPLAVAALRERGGVMIRVKTMCIAPPAGVA